MDEKVLKAILDQSSLVKSQGKVLSEIKESLIRSEQAAAGNAEEALETKKAQKDQQAEQKKQSSLLAGLLGIMKDTTAKSKIKESGMLGTVAKLGALLSGAATTAFFGTVGVLAATITSIVQSPAFIAVRGALKVIQPMFISFLKLFERIGMFLKALPLGFGKVFEWLGKGVTKFFGIFSKLGNSLSNIMKNKTVVAVMEKTSKFLRPFTRLASWLFAGFAFFEGWGKAEEIFGKEGEATIVERFASGVAGVIDFLSFGFISTEKSAIKLKETFDFFKLAIEKPGEAWKKITDWWDKWDFNKSIVDPMVKMFDDFPKKVRAFIDGPLSEFASKATTMIKDFVFGKGKEGEEGATGGLLGAVKSFFSAKNIVNAVNGLAKLYVGFNKMLISLVAIPLIGTQGKWTDKTTWGGLFGFLKDNLTWKNIKSAGEGLINIATNVGTWLGDIFTGLFNSAKNFLKENLTFDWSDVLASFNSAKNFLKESLTFEMKPFDFDITGSLKTLVRNMLDTLSWVPGLDTSDLWKWANAKPQKKKETKTPKVAPFNRILLDDKRGDKSGWTGLNQDTQLRAQMMSNMFGGLRITSGQRDMDKQIKAMERMDSLKVYKQKWQDAAGDDLDSKPGTPERKRAVQNIIAAGYQTQHSHGEALDFSYPAGFGPDSFPELKSVIDKAFPGSNLIKEKDHLHLGFKGSTIDQGFQAKFSPKQKILTPLTPETMKMGGGNINNYYNAPTINQQNASTFVAQGAVTDQLANTNRNE